MLEVLIVFGLGYLFGKYTDKCVDYIINLYKKYIDKK